MPVITVTVTNEQVKAVEGIVINAADWLQAAWDGKANNSTIKVLIEESNLNPAKMTGQEKSDWVRDNPVKTRVQKNLDALT